MKLRRRSGLGWAFVAVLVSTSAVSHSPGLLDGSAPILIEDAGISRALYGAFRTGEEVFVLRLTFAEDFAFPLEVFVPHRAELKEHRPAYALVGQGLPPLSSELQARLPRPLPAGWGAFVDFSDEVPRPVFYENFTRRYFWSSGVTGYVVPKGTHALWIWSPQKTAGKVGVGFGVEEDVEWSKALKNWSDYAY
jgi:hypothetical protein